MKCNFLITDVSYGGGRKYLEQILSCEIFEEVTVFSATYSSKEKQICKELAVELIELSFFNLLPHRKNITIINSQASFWKVFWFLVLLPNVFYVSHGFANGFRYQNMLRKFLFLISINFPHLKIVACGDDELLSITALSPFKEHYVVRNGIDIAMVDHQPPELVSPTCLGFYGRLSYQKGFDTLIEAASRLGFPIIAYGDWEDLKFKDYCEKLAQKLNVDLDLKGYVALSDISFVSGILYVAPSRFEGLPFSPLEFSNLSIPLLLSSCRGHQELYSKDDFLFFISEDVDDLVKVIQSISPVKMRESVLKRRKIREKYGLAFFCEGWKRCLR